MAMYRSDEDRMKRIEEQLDALQKQGLPAARMFGYEYKSKRRILGMPLVHIAQGLDPATGRPRVARGFVAIGNIAIGVFALGGIAVGGVALGGFSVGLLALGGMALGVLLGAGGMAVGCLALGGMAVGYYALGGLALGVHALGGNAQDPALLRAIQDFFHTYSGARP